MLFESSCLAWFRVKGNVFELSRAESSGDEAWRKSPRGSVEGQGRRGSHRPTAPAENQQLEAILAAASGAERAGMWASGQVGMRVCGVPGGWSSFLMMKFGLSILRNTGEELPRGSRTSRY